MYELRYAPLARQDLAEIVRYIAFELHAPATARKLLEKIEKQIGLLRDFPYAHPLFRSRRTLKDEFRLMPVENYLVFYVVADSMVEIRRVLYAASDTDTRIVE